MLIDTRSAARILAAKTLQPASATREDNLVACIRACAHEAHFNEHLLAVRWVRGGRAHVTIGERAMVLDDDTYLIVNEGRSYDIRFRNATPMQSYAVYFKRGLAAEVLAGLAMPSDVPLTAASVQGSASVAFGEHLYDHDSTVSPVLHFMERHLNPAISERAWVDEQVLFLLERMFRKVVERARRGAAGGAVRASTRREIVRRIALATDYIHSCYDRPIALADLGAAAALSPHHLLRLFKLVNGCTPREYLQAKRARVAARLITTTELTLEEIAHRVGFEDRSTLRRQLCRVYGANARQLRKARAVEPIAHDSIRAAQPISALDPSGRAPEVLAIE
jgi:AraC-like DNA-binding protein